MVTPTLSSHLKIVDVKLVVCHSFNHPRFLLIHISVYPSKTAITTIRDLHKEYVNRTELSKYIWKLKDGGETPSVTWNIMSFVNCRPRGGVCTLCLTEKLWLLKHFNDVNLLNKKSEFISKCRHENKLLIKSAEKG